MADETTYNNPYSGVDNDPWGSGGPSDPTVYRPDLLGGMGAGIQGAGLGGTIGGGYGALAGGLIGLGWGAFGQPYLKQQAAQQAQEMVSPELQGLGKSYQDQISQLSKPVSLSTPGVREQLNVIQARTGAGAAPWATGGALQAQQMRALAGGMSELETNRRAQLAQQQQGAASLFQAIQSRRDAILRALQMGDTAQAQALSRQVQDLTILYQQHQLMGQRTQYLDYLKSLQQGQGSQGQTPQAVTPQQPYGTGLALGTPSLTQSSMPQSGAPAMTQGGSVAQGAPSATGPVQSGGGISSALSGLTGADIGLGGTNPYAMGGDAFGLRQFAQAPSLGDLGAGTGLGDLSNDYASMSTPDWLDMIQREVAPNAAFEGY